MPGTRKRARGLIREYAIGGPPADRHADHHGRRDGQSQPRAYPGLGQFVDDQQEGGQPEDQPADGEHGEGQAEDRIGVRRVDHEVDVVFAAGTDLAHEASAAGVQRLRWCP